MKQYQAYPVEFDVENARFLSQSIGKRGVFNERWVELEPNIRFEGFLVKKKF